MSQPVCRHFLISGRVQGVGFRASTHHAAQRFHVHGWVRNLPDGRVEVLAWGKPSAMQQFEAWCQHGPAHAHVTHLDATDASPDSTEPGFTVRH